MQCACPKAAAVCGCLAILGPAFLQGFPPSCLLFLTPVRALLPAGPGLQQWLACFSSRYPPTGALA